MSNIADYFNFFFFFNSRDMLRVIKVAIWLKKKWLNYMDYLQASIMNTKLLPYLQRNSLARRKP